jgi:hypothetical protein
MPIQLTREVGVGDPVLRRPVEQALEHDVGVPATARAVRRFPERQVARANMDQFGSGSAKLPSCPRRVFLIRSVTPKKGLS